MSHSPTTSSTPVPSPDEPAVTGPGRLIGSGNFAPWVLWPTAVIVLAFVVVTMVFPEPMEAGIGAVQMALIANFSAYYVLIAFLFVVFCFALVVSRKGGVRLGRADQEPEFSLLSWFALLFAAGMGIGLVFFGVTEPVSHFANPRPELAPLDPTPGERAEYGLATTFLHWGLQPWALYAVVGLSIGLAIHRRGRPLSVRWAMEPLIGVRATRGGWGDVVDIVALTTTVFGVATSLGLGVTQINAGLVSLGVIDESNEWFQFAAIAVITLCVLWSVLSGVSRGMKWLSTTNLVLAAGLLLFVLIVGPTQVLTKGFVQSLGAVMQNYLGWSLSTSAFTGEAGVAWQSSWSTFYWAWWLAWAPFVGVFIARISRGRTIREFIIGTILVPTLLCAVWFSILGGTAIYNEINPPAGYQSVIGPDGAVDSNSALFQAMEQIPGGVLIVIGAILLSAIFFITSADSGSLVMAMIATGGNPEPKGWIRVLFTLVTALLSASLLLAGGLTAIQTLSIIIGLPFSVLMIMMCIASWRTLGNSVRRHERLQRQAFLSNISEKFGLETDDDAQESGPISADAWWAGLSRERRRSIVQDVHQGTSEPSGPGTR